MKRRLFWKFLFTYILIGIIGFVLIATLGSRITENALIDTRSLSMYREASRIATYQASRYYTGDSSLSDTYGNLAALADFQGSQIWLVSTEGEILLNTASDPDAGDPAVLAGFDPIALGSDYYSVGKFFGYFSSDMLSVLVPVTSNLNIQGYVAVHLPMNTIYQDREYLLARFYLLFLILFLLFLSVLVLVALAVNRPLKKIIKGAQEYASGNLDYNIPVSSADEMGYLARTLNYMSDEMNKTGEYQRKFIANVSHDFRSPLTSIKGYVEAILDGTIPPEMQERYLKIVLFETDRLNKLTQGMLTLNNMDTKGYLLEITDFDINAVIKETAASFEGTCTEKHISIELIFAAKTLLVSADYGKIQQVLYNLIDNAIKFSRNDSSIRIETTERHGKVSVSVKDHGIGIPRSSISRIWERFYKIDASRGRDRKGTGLGLAIVKEIISAHNQNITVVSTEGAGTEFVFTLDKAGS
jgi:signal transduction histidine kinase